MENQVENSTPLNFNNSPFTFKSIFKESLNRFKNRIFQYLLSNLYLFLIVALGGAISAIIGVLNKYLLIISLIIIFPILFYFFIWFTLTSVLLLISDTKLKVSEALQKSKPLIFKAILFFLMSGLFIIGLLPLGILSLSIILFLWYFWGIFSFFILIEKQEKGLKNLWLSKQLVTQRFWKIVGYSLLIQLIGIAITLITFGFGSFLIYLQGIFYLCFTYEIYKKLEAPQQIKTPNMWLWFSIFGWAILILISIFAYANNDKINLLLQNKIYKNNRNLYTEKSYQNNDQYKSLNDYATGKLLMFRTLPAPKGWTVDKFDAKNGTFTYKNIDTCKLSLHQIKIQPGIYASNKEYSDLFFSKLIEPKTNNITNKSDYEILILDYKKTNNYLFKGLKYNFISESSNKFTEALVSYIKNETALMIFLSCKTEDWDENIIKQTFSEIEVSDGI